MKSKLQQLAKGVKWTSIAAFALGGWLAAAWIKASVTLPTSPLEIQRTLVVQPLPPEKGSVVMTLPCVPVKVQIPKGQVGAVNNALSQQSHTPASQTDTVLMPLESDHVGSLPSEDQSQSNMPGTQSPVVPGFLYPLNLGSYKIPPLKDPRVYRAELQQDGTMQLHLIDTGGRFRLGGARYGFLDLIVSSQREAGMVGVHQDLGRTFRVEWMVEAAAGLERQTVDGLRSDWEFGWQLRFRAAIPF